VTRPDAAPMIVRHHGLVVQGRSCWPWAMSPTPSRCRPGAYGWTSSCSSSASCSSPFLRRPTGPETTRPRPQARAAHPYADLAGSTLRRAGSRRDRGAPCAAGERRRLPCLLLPAQPAGVGGLFPGRHHLAQRKETLMACGCHCTATPTMRTATLARTCAEWPIAHVKNAGTHPDVGIPAQLTIASWDGWRCGLWRPSTRSTCRRRRVRHIRAVR